MSFESGFIEELFELYYPNYGNKGRVTTHIQKHNFDHFHNGFNGYFAGTAGENPESATSAMESGNPKKRQLSGESFGKNPDAAEPMDTDSVGGGDPSTENSRRSATPEPGRKRKKIDPVSKQNPVNPYGFTSFFSCFFQAAQMQTLYDFIRRYRREDGSELCDTFIRAPKRRTDPAYYDVVTDPIGN